MRLKRQTPTASLISLSGVYRAFSSLQTKISLKLRYSRKPMVGDKFATRHGQKGVLGTLWKAQDMPFNGTTGMVPDILFNPHGFPSRMTIGQLIESMAGKACAMEGRADVDASAFRSYRGYFTKPEGAGAAALAEAKLGQSQKAS